MSNDKHEENMMSTDELNEMTPGEWTKDAKEVEEAKTLQDLSAGDRVILKRIGVGRTREIHQIERVTQTLIILDSGAKYSRKDGWQVPKGSFDRHHLVLAEGEELKKALLENAWFKARLEASVLHENFRRGDDEDTILKSYECLKQAMDAWQIEIEVNQT